VRKKKAPRVTQAARVELEARVTIVQAADIHRTLLKRLASGRPLLIDGNRVEEIDTAILQMLASLWRSSRDRGIACSWLGASDALRRAARLIGVAELLQFPDGESTAGGSDAAV